MGFWRRLGDAFRAPAATFDAGSRPVDQVIWEMLTRGTPLKFSRVEAMSVPAVLKGRNLLCSIATLPLVQYDAEYNKVPLPLLQQIDPAVANVVTLAQTIEDLLFEGRSLWRITGFGWDGYPATARHVDSSAWRVIPAVAQPYAPLPSGDNPRPGAVPFVDGEQLDWSEVILFESPNPGLLTGFDGRAIRRAILLDKAAGIYAEGGKPLDYFSPADGADPVEDDDIKDILAQWKAARREGSTAYVPAALKYNPVDSPSPADLQLVELQKQAMLEVANVVGLDPEDVGVSTTSRTYFNAQDRRMSRINDTLAPYMRAITDRLSMGDVTKRGYCVEFDLDNYLKADPATRWGTYQTAVAMKAMTIDEVREEERLPPLPAAEAEEQDDAQEVADMPPMPEADQMAPSFSADDPGFVFDDFDVAATFAVNEQKRTITGIVMPWDRVGRAGGERWVFAKDSLRYEKAYVNRIKLIEDHDATKVVGRLNRTWSDDAGQWGEFKVARGPEGDRALALAADGVKDGLSVGVGFSGADHGMTFSRDTDASGPLRRVTAAPWRETSLVAIPAFDGARVSAVAMAADGRKDMTETEPQAPAVPAAAPVSYSAEQVAAMFAALKPAQPTPAPEPRPTVVPPSAAKVTAEPPMYRFDGSKGARCFTADIATGFEGDPVIRRNAERYMGDLMAAAFANITVSNVTTLNPTLQRPDLYVPNLYFSRPIGSMVTGGVVDSITTSTLPKFSSSSGLAQAHVEGTEPTEGAFATTSQVVTPAAIDGLLKINREVIDQGGSPQADQIMWNEMTQFYAKLLEQRLVDALQALSLSDTPIVGVDSGLQSALLTYFSTLQFIAGGDRYRGLALHSDLYTAVITAVDNDGRALFPMNSAVNNQGTVESDLSAVRVGAKVGVPCWALASGNGGPDKSFLFAPESVYQWFSPPRRIDLSQVAVSYVGIGIWGYSAEFITRNADVKQLAYTSS